MSDTTLYYNPAYTNGDTYTFDWAGVTFNSSDLGNTYIGSPTQFNTGQVPNYPNLANVIFGTLVTGIGNNAFQSCSKLTSVVIPNSVITIGNYVFLLCNNLATVTIGKSVSSIGINVFVYCPSLISITVDIDNINYSSLNGVLYNINQKILIQYPAGLFGSFTIPNSVTNIGYYAFAGSYNLSSITISNSVTDISVSAFEACNQLLSVIIPNSVINISEFAFNGCAQLTNVRIGNSVTNIGGTAFNDCVNLTTVTISNATANLLNASWNSPTPNPPGINNFYNAPLVAFLEPPYFPPPTITSVSPNSGNKDGGTPVTITGTNFLETISVTFGGTNATSYTVVSPTQISCVAPAGPAGLINIVVTNADGSYTATSAFTNNIICFKEGSKILTDKGYKLVQELRNGDLIKTVSSGFKKIEHIGYSKMYHNVNEVRSNDKLYRCCKTEYPELIEDLVITGCHSILVKKFKDHEQKIQTKEIIGDNYVTEKYYRLPACVDDRTQIFEEEGVHTIWHFSLENSDYYMNYGVYANGLLVETTSNRMMVELSGMTLI